MLERHSEFSHLCLSVCICGLMMTCGFARMGWKTAFGTFYTVGERAAGVG